MRFSWKSTVAVFAGILALGLVMSVCLSYKVYAQSSTNLVLYDNFASPSIDPKKWLGVDCDPTALRDTVRRVVADEFPSSSGLLHLYGKAYALTNTDIGGNGCPFGLQFPVLCRNS